MQATDRQKDFLMKLGVNNGRLMYSHLVEHYNSNEEEARIELENMVKNGLVEFDDNSQFISITEEGLKQIKDKDTYRE